MHPVDRLFQALCEVEPYPPGVCPIPRRIVGPAFFPGGAGLWEAEPGSDSLPPMPIHGIMVLGHDFPIPKRPSGSGPYRLESIVKALSGVLSVRCSLKLVSASVTVF
jgi:hypothetical protein